MKYTTEYMYLKGVLKALKLNHALKALSLMHEAHETQTRNDGTPYYSHPVKVTSYLLALDISDDLIFLDKLFAVALLHDVLEDTSIDYKRLKDIFGEEIANSVDFLTKKDYVSEDEYYANIKTDLIATLVKCSDRCHNVSSMAGVFNKKRLQKYVSETEKHVMPLIRHIRETRPEISEKAVIISYQIKSVINAIKVMIPLMTDEVKKN